jgi:hypothetical protein
MAPNPYSFSPDPLGPSNAKGHKVECGAASGGKGKRMKKD